MTKSKAHRGLNRHRMCVNEYPMAIMLDHRSTVYRQKLKLASAKAEPICDYTYMKH